MEDMCPPVPGDRWLWFVRPRPNLMNQKREGREPEESKDTLAEEGGMGSGVIKPQPSTVGTCVSYILMDMRLPILL